MEENESGTSPTPLSPLFDTEAKPPRPVLLIAGVQHTLAMFAGVVMVPLIIAKALQVGPAETSRFISMALLVSGIATLIQVNRLGPIGSGYLCVMGSSAVFIEPAIVAGRTGGLALVFGMTLLLAPIEAVMSRLTHVLRVLAPRYVIGTVIILIGLSLVPISLAELAGGRGASDFGSPRNLGLGVFTIAVVVVASVSGRLMLRVSSFVLGILAGYGAAAMLGVVDLSAARSASMLSLPRPLWAGLRFDLALLLPFVVAYFVTTIETFGDMNAIGEISEGSLDKVDDRRISGGLLADAVGSLLAGLFGTTANTSYGGNIAMVQLTGVASRRVGIVVGACLIALSFTPKLSAVIGAMPHPVIGGVMVVAVAILISIGMRIAMRDKPDNTKFIVIGTSIAVGLGIETVPEACRACPDALQTLFKSGPCLGALWAVLLNLALGRGAASRH